MTFWMHIVNCVVHLHYIFYMFFLLDIYLHILDYIMRRVKRLCIYLFQSVIYKYFDPN